MPGHFSKFRLVTKQYLLFDPIIKFAMVTDLKLEGIACLVKISNKKTPLVLYDQP